MTKSVFTFAVAVGLAFPGTLRGQGHEQHHPQGEEQQPQRGMMMGGQQRMGHDVMGMMMAGPSPSLILRQKDALNLNESQVQRLEAINKQLTEARQARMREAAPLHEQFTGALEGDKPDLAKYEVALKKLAEHHVAMQVQAARFSLQALDVLTPEQRANVRYGMRLMRGMMGGGMMGGGMGTGGMGMMQGMMGGGMGMMGPGDCPMPMMEGMGTQQKQP